MISCFRNATINKFKNITEIVHYKTDFQVLKNTTGQKLKEYVDYETGEIKTTNRNFVKTDDNVYIPVDPYRPLSDYAPGLRRSARRSKDSFYGYALSNTWDYFLTVTFDPKELESGSDEEVKRLWSSFRKSITRRKGFENIKLLIVPERHKSGTFHFHGLIGNVNLDKFLSPAINKSDYVSYYDYEKSERVFVLDKNGNKIPNKFKGMELKTEFGDTVYNLDIWKHGYSTVVKINTKDNQLKIANYMIEYVSKQDNVGYNKKSYYRTRNLEFKETESTYLSEDDLENILNSYGLGYEIIKKETNSLVSYKIIKKE